MPSTPAVTAPPDDLHTLCRWSAMLVFPCLLPLQSLPLQMICIPCAGGQQCLFSHAFYPCSHCPSRWFASCVQVTNDVVPLYTSAPEVHCAYCVQVIDDSRFPIPINPCGPCSRWYASCILCAGHQWFLCLYTHQPLRSMFLQAICIMHTVCRSSTIFVPLYPSAPVVHVPPSDMDRAYCVQVIDDSHSSIPCGPCSSKWYGSCILCAGHRRFSFPHTLWSTFLQVIWIMHTVCRSSTILIPPYPVVHVPPSDMDHAYCVQVIDDSHSSIPCGPRSSKWYGSCILCAGHRRFSFPHTLWSTFLQVIWIMHTVCRSSTILIPPYPVVRVPPSDMDHAYCVQVIDDSHSSIPCGPRSSKWYGSCILCAGHRRFSFPHTLWSTFLQVIWIMHTVCRSSMILIPPYPVVRVPPSDMDHAYCVQVINDSHSPIPCGPRSSKWYGSCILCAGHRRFSFPHTHQPLRSMSSRLLKSGGVAGGTSSSSLEKAILKKKRKKKKKKKKKKKVRSYPSRNAIQSPTIPEEDEEDEDVSFTGQYLLLLSISFRRCSLKMSLLIVQQTCFHSARFLQSFCVNFWCNTSCSRSRKMFG